MDWSRITPRGVVLLGCGKMGSALLSGWLARGLLADAVTVIEPNPTDWLRETGVGLNTPLPDAPAITLIAVKPQMMQDALPALRGLQDTLFVTIAAGIPIATYEGALGDIRLVRAMPNTPAAVAKGITAIIGNGAATAADLDLADQLLAAVGDVVRLDREDQMDAVTGLSGSGPAYVFH
ncbi:MAG: NAD(P)-binding domain-containing protein, partial [Pseudomonadota bacterium]